MPRLNDPRIAAATAPLPAGAPAPAEFREDPDFEALDGEIRKLEREGPTAVHWPEVIRLAEAALATKSKDLTVAVWLAAALAQTEGLAGLTVGLAILRDLVEQQWDTLFPPKARVRARSGVLEWLASRSVRAVPAELAAGQAEAVLAAWEELHALDGLLAEKIPPDGVSLTELVRPLRRLADEARQQQAAAAPPPAPQPGPAGGPGGGPAGAAASAAAAPVAAAGPAAATPAPAIAAAAIPPPGADPEKSLSSLRDVVRDTALALLEANLAEPRGYSLLRAVTWLGITDPPPATDGRTAIMPPPAQREAEFAALRGAGNLPELVLALERYCSGSGIFWLDGHRLSAMALAELGPRHAGCVGAIVQGVAALVARLPSLRTLAFSDGRPFADPGTNAWIDTVVLPQPTNGAANGEAEPWRPALADARTKLLEGKAEAGLTDLVTGGNTAPNGRARFFWGLAQARFCLEAGSALVALPVLQHLDRLIERHGLEEWEPAAVTEGARLLYDCLATPELAKLLSETDRTVATQAAFARLARLDPVLATQAAKSVH
ncbi:MAG: type VI secretion system protein TssA [Acetobacteraceae bacterium]